MHELASDVWQIPVARGERTNAYLVGDVLVDAGTKSQARRLLRAVEDRPVRALAVTHAHPGHAGGAGYVQDEREGVALWVGRGDARALEDGEPELGRGLLVGLFGSFAGAFDGRPADRELSEGDELAAGFVVLETPGHSAGHVCFWRERDRVLLCGDVLLGRGGPLGRPGLHLPRLGATPDPAGNTAAIKRLATLEPAVVGFGHGPPLRAAAGPLEQLARSI